MNAGLGFQDSEWQILESLMNNARRRESSLIRDVPQLCCLQRFASNLARQRSPRRCQFVPPPCINRCRIEPLKPFMNHYSMKMRTSPSNLAPQLPLFQPSDLHRLQPSRPAWARIYRPGDSDPATGPRGPVGRGEPVSEAPPPGAAPAGGPTPTCRSLSSPRPRPGRRPATSGPRDRPVADAAAGSGA